MSRHEQCSCTVHSMVTLAVLRNGTRKVHVSGCMHDWVLETLWSP